MAKIAVPVSGVGKVRRLFVGPTELVCPCSVEINALSGASYCYSRSVPERVILKNVKVYVSARAGGGIETSAFRIFTGSGEPKSAAEILQWQELVGPVSPPTVPEWRFNGLNNSLSWDMNIFLEGPDRRFGLWCQTWLTNLTVFEGSFQVALI